MKMDLNNSLFIFILTWIIFCFKETSSAIIQRHDSFIAPVNPCRKEDNICSVKCKVLRLTGDFNCAFCYCANKDDYKNWDTTISPDATSSSLPLTTLPPGIIEANNIRYHKVPDPCIMSHDRVCPLTCKEKPSVKQDGTLCTKCDCDGVALFMGG